MTSLALRIILTIAGLISMLCDCHNETMLRDNGRLYFEFDIYKIIILITIWFI